MSKEEVLTDLLVTYSIAGEHGGKLHNRTVSVSASLAAHHIPMVVKQQIRPAKSPDPSDNYRGQQPSDVVIVNLVNLSKLL